MTHRISDKSSRDAMDKIFALYDDEKTGYLSVKNLRRVAQDLGENISEEELQEMIDRADTDRDGLVSADEFYVILTRPMKDWCCILDAISIRLYKYKSNVCRTISLRGQVT